AAVETLGRQDAEFRLRQIEPAAVLWRVMPFEPLDQPPGFGGREGLVERSFAVDVKVVLDQNNDLGGGEVSIGEVLQDMSVITLRPEVEVGPGGLKDGFVMVSGL